jgi:hypothetical protein
VNILDQVQTLVAILSPIVGIVAAVAIARWLGKSIVNAFRSDLEIAAKSFSEPPEKPKRKNEWLEAPDGELLEVIEDDGTEGPWDAKIKRGER